MDSVGQHKAVGTSLCGALLCLLVVGCTHPLTQKTSNLTACIEPLPPSITAKNRGLFIGANGMLVGDDQITYSVKDAISLAGLFALKLGFIPPHRCVVLINEPVPESDFPLREVADELFRQGAQIIVSNQCSGLALELLEESAKEPVSTEGALVMFFSGHGFAVNGKRHFVMGTEDRVSLDRLLSKLQGSSFSNHFLILDSCRLELPQVFIQRFVMHESPGTTSLLPHTVFHSSRRDQDSKEVQLLHRGIFSFFLIAALGADSADHFLEKEVTFEDLARRVTLFVSKYRTIAQVGSGKQIPDFESHGGNPRVALCRVRLRESSRDMSAGLIPPGERIFIYSGMIDAWRRKLDQFKRSAPDESALGSLRDEVRLFRTIFFPSSGLYRLEDGQSMRRIIVEFEEEIALHKVNPPVATAE